MSDHLKLLDGTVDEIAGGVAALSPADRAALLAAEKDGKKRKGVIALLQPAEGEVEKSGDGAAADMATTTHGLGTDGSESADIPPATQFDPSGAPVQIVPGVDMEHPAVDANPRSNTTENQNRIDFNDPTKEGVDVVMEQLGMKKPDNADEAE